MMKKIRFVLFLPLVALLGTAGCKKTDFAAQQQAKSTTLKLGDFIKNNFEFSIFTAAMTKAGLLDSLNDPNSIYTVFVPSDAAFSVDSIVSVKDLDKFTADSLRYIVRTHIMRGRLFASDIPVSLDNLYANLNGDNLYMSASTIYGSAYVVSGVQMQTVQTATSVTATYDIPLANGVLHILQRPIKYWKGTVQDFLAHRPELSTFVTGLQRFGQWDSLGKAAPYTVVAPVNNAFTMNGITADSIAGMDTANFQPALFSGYVAYSHHVFVSDANIVANVPLIVAGGYQLAIGYAGFILSSPTGTVLGPLAGSPNYDDRYSKPLNPGSMDYLCSNGIVHVIGNLLLLPSDVRK